MISATSAAADCHPVMCSGNEPSLGPSEGGFLEQLRSWLESAESDSGCSKSIASFIETGSPIDTGSPNSRTEENTQTPPEAPATLPPAIVSPQLQLPLAFHPLAAPGGEWAEAAPIAAPVLSSEAEPASASHVDAVGGARMERTEIGGRSQSVADRLDREVEGSVQSGAQTPRAAAESAEAPPESSAAAAPVGPAADVVPPRLHLNAAPLEAAPSMPAAATASDMAVASEADHVSPATEPNSAAAELRADVNGFRSASESFMSEIDAPASDIRDPKRRTAAVENEATYAASAASLVVELPEIPPPQPQLPSEFRLNADPPAGAGEMEPSKPTPASASGAAFAHEAERTPSSSAERTGAAARGRAKPAEFTLETASRSTSEQAPHMAFAARMKPAADSQAASSAVPASDAARRMITPVHADAAEMDDHAAPPSNPLAFPALPAGMRHYAAGEIAPSSAVDVSEAPAQAEAVLPLRDDQTVQPRPPLKELSVQLSDSGNERVEVRLMERAGELRVAVRTDNHELAHSLREGLPELVSRLESNGFRTEGWRPGHLGPSPASASQSGESAADFRNADAQSQSGWSQQQREDQQHSHPSHKPRWVEELEATWNGNGLSTPGGLNGFIA